MKDSREIKAETRSSRESLERRDREREKERGREKERSDAYRKEEPPPDDRAYGRGHGRDDGGRTESKLDRAERNGRGRGRANEASDKGPTPQRTQDLQDVHPSLNSCIQNYASYALKYLKLILKS